MAMLGGLKGEMSALGHEQTSRNVRVMSVVPLKADIHQRGVHVRLVPKADVGRCQPKLTSSEADDPILAAY